ncbi:MAG TPA: DUF4265 domain-containing protein [Anaeromyxobacter sp.]
MRHEEMVKISFRIDPERSGGMVGETLWAERVGADRFRLASIPFFVRGVSYRDVVFGRPGRYGVLTFRGVSIRGGHSTCRMFVGVDLKSAVFRERWAELHGLGCGYEGAGGHTLALDIPPEADLDTVLGMLEAGAAAGLWEYEMAHCGHPVGERGGPTPAARGEQDAPAARARRRPPGGLDG